MTTAIQAAQRLLGRRGRVLLHSGEDTDGCGRLSYVACDPDRVVEAYGRDVVVRDAEGRAVARFEGDAVAVVEELARANAGDPVSAPVAIGFISYDYGRVLHARLAPAAKRPGHPDLWFGIYRAVWRRDERSGVCDIVGCDSDAKAKLAEALAGPIAEAEPPRLAELTADADADAQYRRGFDRLLEYIRAGDTYQVNLSRRLSARVLAPGDSLSLYRSLAEQSPAAYGALLDTGDISVVSASPERLLAVNDAHLETRPIKGTRRRTGDTAVDAALAAELARDEKERAEHLMIVDLERNDLGRVAEIGSVRVDGFARVVALPTLFHMVSTVSCRVRSGISVSEIVAATFPGGSITGAPKLRAMQIIDELEPHDRGVYTGAIGTICGDGSVDFSIAIRTGVLGRDRLDVCVGGGVVADSTHTRELEETEEKASAWRCAVSELY